MSDPHWLHVSLQPSPHGTGHWVLTVHESGQAPAIGQVSSAALADLPDPNPQGGGALMCTDARAAAAELHAGAALSQLLAASGDAGRRWVGAVARAHDRATPLGIAVYATGPAHRLPWELLACPETGVGLESSGRAVVVRQSGQRPSARPAPVPRPVMLTWCPTPQDPTCAQRLTTLAEDAHARGIAMSTDAAGACLAVVVCHGLSDLGVLELALADGRAGPTAAVDGIRDLLKSVPMVIVEVCHGGEGAELQTLAGIVAAAGAEVVTAPLRPATTRMLTVFSRAAMDAVVEGQPPLQAAAAGRRAVRQHAWALPPDRWHGLGIWAVPGVRTGSTRGWLEQARALAEERADGGVGIEHLLAVLLLPEGRRLAGTVQRRLRQRLDRGVPHPLLGWDALVLKPTTADRPGGHLPESPRLRTILDSGTPLQTALVEHWPPALTARLQVSPHEDTPHADPEATRSHTRKPPAPPLPGARAWGLEVVGGPEDGRRLALVADTPVGRASGAPQPGPGLYAQCARVDARLSRWHLTVGAAGEVHARQRTARWTGSAWVDVDNPLDIAVGTLLRLGTSTTLVGIPAP